MIRVAVVDDHPIVRDGVIANLEDDPEIRVIAGGATAADALRIVRTDPPDAMILDLELPDRNGIDIIREIKAAAPQVRVVVFTAYAGEERVGAAFAAGADSYVVKGTPAAELVATVRAVAAGRTHIAPAIAAQLAATLRTSPRERLTDRERAIVRLLAEGLPNKAIAQQLGITERTVKFHVSSIIARLGVQNRAQAVIAARERGVL